MLLRLLTTLAVASLLLSGCAVGRAGQPEWNDPEVKLVWPEAPAEPRVAYLRSVSVQNIREGRKGTSGRLFQWLTGQDAPVQPLAQPYGLAADGAGRIWVADPGSQALYIFDLARGAVDYWTTAGDKALVSPAGVAVARERNRVFISDSVAGRVAVLDLSGHWLADLQPRRPFQRPAGMAIGPAGRLYVVDVLGGRVEVFSPDLEPVRTIRGHDAAGFNHPTAVAVADDGRVYIVDGMNFRVEVQDADGDFLGYIGKLGDTPGTFARPRGVALDSQGHVYVSDAAFDNVQVFDREGRLLMYFGQPGKGPGQFCLPAGLFADGDDRLYVVDSCNFRVQIFQYLGGG